MRRGLTRRAFVGTSATAVATCALSGCAGQMAGGLNGAPTLPQVAADDEVVTLSSVAQDKTVITVRTEYNVDDTHMKQALETAFPDKEFVFTLHCSPTTFFELRQSLRSGTAEDIIISPNMQAISDIAPQTLLDLSAKSFTDAYDGAALEACQIDGKLYYLPGPSNTFGIIYDKTLFAANGWQVPRGYTQFVDLCKRIEATGIRAIQPSCKYARQAQMVFTMFAYAQVFGGVSNISWLLDYQQGTASMKGHLEPAFARYSELANADIIRADDFDVQPGNRSTMMYTDHTCAMIIENQMAETYAKQAKSDHTYAMMPFWCGEDEESQHMMNLPNYYVGVNAALGDESHANQLNAVMEVLEWLSTPEGQLAVAGGTLNVSSSVKDVPLQQTDFNQGIVETTNLGNCVSEVNLMASGNGNAAQSALQKGLRAYLQGTMTAEAVMASCDKARDEALQSGFDYGTPVGQASADFTRMQTGMFIADVLREHAQADIGLCMVGQINCGMVGRFYGGTITDKDIAQLSLSSGKTNGWPNDKKLWKLQVSGAQLRDLLARPYTTKDADSIWNQPYFAVSGLRIAFAPWADAADKIVSVQRENGSELDDDALYSVAMWCWPFKDACPYTVQQVYSETDTALVTQVVAARGTIVPIDDGRMTLVYL